MQEAGQELEAYFGKDDQQLEEETLTHTLTRTDTLDGAVKRIYVS